MDIDYETLKATTFIRLVETFSSEFAILNCEKMDIKNVDKYGYKDAKEVAFYDNRLDLNLVLSRLNENYKNNKKFKLISAPLEDKLIDKSMGYMIYVVSNSIYDAK